MSPVARSAIWQLAAGLPMALMLALSWPVAAAEPRRSSGADGALDPAQAWAQVLDHGDFNKVYDAYGVLAEIYGDGSEATTDACKREGKKLDAAVDTVPAGLALWYAIYECANLQHEDARAEQALAAFSALLRHGLANRAVDAQTPMRVISEYDIDATVRASGQDLLYQYYDYENNRRYLTMNVALWDTESKQERWLRFDFIDTMMRLQRNQPIAEFPAFREGLRAGILKQIGTIEGSPAYEARVLREILAIDDIKARLDAAEQAAIDGNMAALAAFSSACLLYPDLGCAERGVDTLLPYAEAHNATAMLWLAFAYAHGRGVEHDDKAARALIDAANKRLPPYDAVLVFTVYSMLAGNKSLPTLVSEDVERARQDGDTRAQILLASLEIEKQGIAASLSPATEDGLRAAAKAGAPMAMTLLGVRQLDLIQRGKIDAKDRQAQLDQAIIWLQQAAEADELRAQVVLGMAYDEGTVVEKDEKLSLRWSMRAGHGGNVAAMKRVIEHYRRIPGADARKRRVGWLESASSLDDIESSLELAQEVQLDNKDGKGAVYAMRVYRDLATRRDSAEARRQLADVLLYDDNDARDPAEALRLLELDANRGDTRSQAFLGSYMVKGRIGKHDRRKGLRWLRKSAKQGDSMGRNLLGWALYTGQDGVRRDVDEALALWQLDADAGMLIGQNNIAWARCTSEEPAVYAPGIGLEMAKRMERIEGLGWGNRDTVAACYAASGDYDRAIAVQSAIVNQLTADPNAPAATIENVTKRLENYRRKQRFVEPLPASR